MMPAKEPLEAGEPLYRRCLQQHVDGDRLYPAAIDLPGCSVNRGAPRFGPMEQVLLGDDTWGIAEFDYGNLPEPITEKGTAYSFDAEHDPKPGNPAHSEIRVSKNGKYNAYRKFAEDIASKLQYLLSERSRIIRAPKR